MAPASTQKPILLAGAGPSTLLLAQRLLKANIPFRVFERDASLAFRGQGYRLRLSDEGLDAIETALGGKDDPRWKKFWETCGKTGGGGLQVFDARTGEPENEGGGEKKKEAEEGESMAKKMQMLSSQEKGGQGGGMPREALSSRDGLTVGIARGEMRDVFMEGCEDYVQFGKRVVGYEMAKDGEGVYALFGDGTKSEEGSLLIGGEGVHSKVAKQLSDGKLKVFDLGARGIHGQAPTTAFKALGEGVFRVIDKDGPGGHHVSIITNVRSGDMDDPNVMFGWTMISQPGGIRAPGDNYSLVGKEAADLAKQLTKDWHPRFKPLFEQMVESEAAFWKITCSNPKGVPQWENNPRVTVIGDAVHSMTPAGGIGWNTASRDSELLGRLLAEAGGYADGLTKKYEDEMRVYGGAAVAQSYGFATKSFAAEITDSTPTV